MRENRTLIFFILALTIFAITVDLPDQYRLQFTFGRIKIDRTIKAPSFNFQLGSFSFRKEFKTKLGLDLAGGTHLVFEAVMKGIDGSDREKAYTAAVNTVERRINMYGLTEPVIQKTKIGESYRIIVEIPGVTDTTEAINLIGRTAQLAFYQEASDAGKIATPSSIYQLWSTPTKLTGKHLKRAEVVFDPSSGKPQVSLEFNDEGSQVFAQITQASIGKTVAIFLDNQLLSAPKVNEEILGGRAVIQGDFSVKQAKALSIALNAGALPVPLEIIEQKNIGATLGQNSVDKSIFAGLIGITTVALFMIVSYGLLGFVADLALLTYTMVVLAIFKIIPVTLTLAGIAGFILSIGMAVDANILIFERMKEEIRWGKDRQTALKLGFERAFPSIRDSNASSLITCGILYWFGTGIIRGFAITLAIGIVISLFSAITVTKTLVKIIYK